MCPNALSCWMWFEEMESGFGERNGLSLKRDGAANIQGNYKPIH